MLCPWAINDAIIPVKISPDPAVARAGLPVELTYPFVFHATKDGENFASRIPGKSLTRLSMISSILLRISAGSLLMIWPNSPRWGVITKLDLIFLA